MIRWRRPGPPTVVAWLAVAAGTALMLPWYFLDPYVSPTDRVWFVTGTLLAGGFLALAAVRPVPAAAALLALANAEHVLSAVRGTAFGASLHLAAHVALYLVLRSPERRRLPWVMAALYLLVTSSYSVNSQWETVQGQLLSNAIILVVVVAAAEVTRRRLHTLSALRERNEALERMHTLEAQGAVAAERARMAREMHDVLAHTVTAMIMQARSGRRAVHRRPDDAAAALDAITAAGQDALHELRRAVGMLREGDPPATRPVSLGDLDRLVETSPVPVRVGIEGTPVRLDPALDHAAYRIVQEALTNVAKHADGTDAALVSLSWRPDRLCLGVSDTGTRAHAQPPHPGGYGLIGMAERAQQVGGRVTAGPSGDGPGWTVTAELPLGRPAPAP